MCLMAELCFSVPEMDERRRTLVRLCIAVRIDLISLSTWRRIWEIGVEGRRDQKDNGRGVILSTKCWSSLEREIDLESLEAHSVVSFRMPCLESSSEVHLKRFLYPLQ